MMPFQLLPSVLKVIPDGAMAVDRRGRILSTNEMMEALFGFNRGELAGESVEVLVPDAFKERHRRDRAEFFVEGTGHRPMGTPLSLRGRRKDGTEFPVDVMLRQIATTRGAVVIAAVRDMTEVQALRSRVAAAPPSAPPAEVGCPPGRSTARSS